MRKPVPNYYRMNKGQVIIAKYELEKKLMARMVKDPVRARWALGVMECAIQLPKDEFCKLVVECCS